MKGRTRGAAVATAAPAAEPLHASTYPAYLRDSFDPQKATVAELKSILASNHVEFSLRGLKADYVALFQQHISSKRNQLLESIIKVQPSSEGIQLVSTSPLKMSESSPMRPDSEHEDAEPTPIAPPVSSIPTIRGKTPTKLNAEMKKLNLGRVAGTGFYATSKPIESPRASDKHVPFGSPVKGRVIEKKTTKRPVKAAVVAAAVSPPPPPPPQPKMITVRITDGLDPLNAVLNWEGKSYVLKECKGNDSTDVIDMVS